MEKHCETCGKQFSVKRYLADGKKNCSKDCRRSANTVELQCCVCGSSFVKWRSQVKEGTKHCSKACADKSKLKPESKRSILRVKRVWTPVYKVCKVCGDEFRVNPFRLDIASFCSIKCKAESPEFRVKCSESQVAEKHWRWSGGKYVNGCGYVRLKRKRRGKEVARYEHVAVMLEWMQREAPNHPFLVLRNGEPGFRQDIQVHHTDRDRANNAKSNLLAVTMNAHAQIHHRNIAPSPEDCWPPNPTRV